MSVALAASAAALASPADAWARPPRISLNLEQMSVVPSSHAGLPCQASQNPQFCRPLSGGSAADGNSYAEQFAKVCNVALNL